MNVFTLEEKRGKIYINTAAIFVHKFYIRKFIVSLVSFWKKKIKIIINFTTRALQIIWWYDCCHLNKTMKWMFWIISLWLMTC